MIEFEFNMDYDKGYSVPHFYKHGVFIEDIEDFFESSNYIEYQRNDESFEAYGQLNSGRCLKIVFRKKTNEVYFIITAHDIKQSKFDSTYKELKQGLE